MVFFCGLPVADCRVGRSRLARKRLVLSLSFVLTLVSGAFAPIHHRSVIYVVIGLTLSAVVVDQIAEFRHLPLARRSIPHLQ